MVQDIYLTFDDGPNDEMDNILDILKTKKVKSTFFLVEPNMREYPQAVLRLIEEGHYPALHSVTHDKRMLYEGNPLNVAEEMRHTQKTLYELTGVTSHLTRAPFGSHPYMKEDLRHGLVQYMMKMWDWNVDTVDWKHHETAPGRIIENAIKGIDAVAEGQIVILLHVTKGTASVLSRLIDRINKDGVQFRAYDPEQHFTMNFWDDNRL
ncbi:polysaccharide deacetylase family protein [Fictibacillus enclensis]|uniref:polysaccharide deacetylase family protein n=1 Tax=Fictibacillus enclensis TaxID=1017270 RepID=UPI0025A2F763|nr:polysaccharide deacetylase family protein [Fictibacillus enclensis]MDM5336462.1 polysaccharide deacetylase family protein [Fictibacillus enclensis]